jgi:zinc transporter ZupT
MTDILANLVVGVAATFIPLFIGLFIPIALIDSSTLRSRLLAAFSSGIMFWFFLDVMNDAVLLDVNQGFGGGFAQALLVGLFAAGLLLLFGLERFSKANSTVTGLSFTVAVLVALGIGFHALGEGVEIGSLIPSAPSMVEAIGGLGQGVAYVLHKLLEGFVIGTFGAFTKLKSLRVATLGLISGLPTIIGLLLAISMSLNSTFFFALGGAATVYVEYKLIPNFIGRHNMLLCVFASLLGFYTMYLAGLFHG